ncbi:hypothetical protein JTB14_022116 [Gonioctena quinquepunctata]|nr:hypothetical protein JTB14_022116 [Gonioctena quinquepunctata]
MKSFGQFQRELKKTTKSKSGDGTDDIYQPKWFAFKNLLFLRDKTKPRTTREAGIEIGIVDTQLKHPPNFSGYGVVSENKTQHSKGICILIRNGIPYQNTNYHELLRMLTAWRSTLLAIKAAAYDTLMEHYKKELKNRCFKLKTPLKARNQKEEFPALKGDGFITPRKSAEATVGLLPQRAAAQTKNSFEALQESSDMESETNHNPKQKGQPEDY